MAQLLTLYWGSLIFRSIGIAVIAGFCTWKMRSAALRHAIWVAVLGTMLLLPVLDMLLPSSWVPDSAQYKTVKQGLALARIVESESRPMLSTPAAPTAAPAPGHPRTLNWWNVAVALYALVAIAMFVRLVIGYRRIWTLKHHARVITSSAWDETIDGNRMGWRAPALRMSESVRVPLTIGFLRPVVLLPADWQTWDDWKLRAVLLHEFAHVRRADWAIAALAATAKCAYWLNPLSWFLEKHLSELAEHASDDASMIWARDTARYAEVLLGFSRAAQNGGRFMKGALAMAQNKMNTRIDRVLANSRSGTGYLKMASWVLILALAMPVLYSAAALHVASEPALAAKPALAVVVGAVPLSEVPTPSTPAKAAFRAGKLSPAAAFQDLIPVELQSMQRSIPAGPTELAELVPPPTGLRPEIQNDSPKSDYRIKDSDELVIFVYNHPELSMNVMVQPDGRISIPLAQNIQAEGLSLGELKAATEKRLREVIEMPNVTVILKAASTYRVFVIGKVQKPGVVTFGKPITVLQALTLAGGFQEYANRNEITIMRTVPSQTENGRQLETRFHFSYDEATRGLNQVQNIFLENGDAVIVP